VETLWVERADGVTTVTLQRPDKKNAMNGRMWRELVEVFDETADDRDTRVLVITGSGDGFCSGADLTDERNADDVLGGVGGAVRSMRVVGRAALRLHELPIPTIAAVNGVAAGAGCNLALGCDLVVAADTARFSEIFLRRGLSLDGGGSWLLPRLIGLHKAKELAFFSDILSADDAMTFGIVNRVVGADALVETVMGMARRLAAQPPVQLALMKRQLNQSFSMTMSEALDSEAVAQTALALSDDAREAMLAFLEKRDPRFTGR
jgi:2-(1,2-epoxy-1,2-dihydrophenyl)acetyl-CoA isomerase